MTSDNKDEHVGPQQNNTDFASMIGSCNRPNCVLWMESIHWLIDWFLIVCVDGTEFERVLSITAKLTSRA